MKQPTTPSRPDAMKQLLQGVADDLAAYHDMLALMDLQFEAAIRHQGERLMDIAAVIGEQCEAMEARRAQRVVLAGQLVGPQAGMSEVAALLKAEPRAQLAADWQQLEAMVQAARQLGKRNAELLADQYSIMQRVLHGEDQTYAPA
jgi:flagella synthesis protein FlgN